MAGLIADASALQLFSTSTVMAESEPEMVSVSPPENRLEIASSSDEKSTKNTKPRLLPYVSLPRLPETNKALYESLVPPLDKSIKVDEVVGEAVDDLMGPLYYGRFEKGIIRGVSALKWTRSLMINA